jgi:hypothetical protein
MWISLNFFQMTAEGMRSTSQMAELIHSTVPDTISALGQA